MGRHRHRQPGVLVMWAALAAGIGLIWSGSPEAFFGGGERLSPSLTSYQPPPGMCLWPSEAESAALRLSSAVQDTFFQITPGAASAGRTIVLKPPTREIKDVYPSFSGIAVDPVRNEVVVTDENLQQIIFYRRTENNPVDRVAQPTRVIGTGVNSPEDKRASRTNIEFQAGVYVDPRNGEVYGVNNDSHDTMVVFTREASGNAPPGRELHIPHGAFGIAVDEGNQELFLPIQHDSAVVVYRKGAKGDEAPIRLLQGDRTRLANPHGIALDPKSGLIFVTNHGSVARRQEAGHWLADNPPANWPLDRGFAVPGSGKMLPPSITVYSRSDSGDTAPVRVIGGPRTLLNWPTGVAVHPDRSELYVANNAGESVLVFDSSAAGDVAPRRVLKGPKTGLKNPTGLALDMQNEELWVANFGNHTATVYPMTTQGDVPPLRTIRSAPAGTPSHMIGNPGGVAYDTRREEILVPN